MLLWFVGMSLVLAWNVFRDPALDHRLLVLGAVLPDLVEAPFGRVGPLHSLVGATGVLAAVMVATVGRRLLRRRLLAIAIGVFFHLVLDGVWATSQAFWWPLQGLAFDDVPIPALDRSPVVAVVLEAAGLAAVVWAWFRFGLTDADRRRRFLRDGHVDRAITDPR